jgi:hypothetical protein
MRSLRILEHISLDGVIEPGGRGEDGDDYAHGGWTAPCRSPAGLEAVVEGQGRAVFRRTSPLHSSRWRGVD